MKMVKFDHSTETKFGGASSLEKVVSIFVYKDEKMIDTIPINVCYRIVDNILTVTWTNVTNKYGV